MINTKCQVEIVREERRYAFTCDYDAPLPEVVQVLMEMRDRVNSLLQDLMKKAEQAKDIQDEDNKQPQEAAV